MSAQVKTPTRTQLSPSIESASCSGQPVLQQHTHQTHAIAQKRRRSHIDNDHHTTVSFSNSAKKRRHGSYRGPEKKLPSKFVLGGNISDPLNLNDAISGNDDIISPECTVPTRVNPEPVQRPASLMYRVNVTDPLNLSVETDGNDVPILLSPSGSRRKRKKRLTKTQLEKLEISFDNSNPSSDVETKDSTTDAQKVLTDAQIPLSTASQLESPTKVATPVKNKSPVIPVRQESVMLKRRESIPGSERKRRPRRDSERSGGAAAEGKKSGAPSPKGSTNRQNKSSKKPTKFIHGNYNRYYGYRNMDDVERDPRLSAFKPSWFKGKDVLDIGCNIGHVTLSIARDFRPKRIVGMDIDANLVKIARKNIRYYQEKKTFDGNEESLNVEDHVDDSDLPMQQIVTFLQGNYLLASDSLLEMVQPEFDIIMALSITKWIHLNNGDAGLKRCFKRMFHQLRPGGRLILEPQQWPSYKRRKNLTDHIKTVFQSIAFKPDQFNEYLLSEVGFSRCEKINMPDHSTKGFRRPVFVFMKAEKELEDKSNQT